MFHADKNNPFQFYDPRSLPCYSDLVVPEGVTIPTTDEAAWNHFEKHGWVYLKLNVTLSQEIRCAPIGFNPDDYPVFVKPICNLLGMGVGARKVSNYEEYKECQHLSGYFWMEHLEGEHLNAPSRNIRKDVDIPCILHNWKPYERQLPSPTDYISVLQKPDNHQDQILSEHNVFLVRE